MLTNYRKSTNISCTSTVTVNEDGVEKQAAVAQMNAHISEDGRPNVTKTIMNKEVFAANVDAVLADMAEFEKRVFLEEA